MATKRQEIGPWQDAWLRSLESGEFKQGTGTLCLRRSGEGFDYAHCCLGVFEEVLIANGVRVPVTEYGISVEYSGCADTLPEKHWRKLRLHSDVGQLQEDRLPSEVAGTVQRRSDNEGWQNQKTEGVSRWHE